MNRETKITEQEGKQNKPTQKKCKEKKTGPQTISELVFVIKNITFILSGTVVMVRDAPLLKI